MGCKKLMLETSKVRLTRPNFVIDVILSGEKI